MNMCDIEFEIFIKPYEKILWVENKLMNNQNLQLAKHHNFLESEVKIYQ